MSLHRLYPQVAIPPPISEKSRPGNSPDVIAVWVLRLRLPVQGNLSTYSLKSHLHLSIIKYSSSNEPLQISQMRDITSGHYITNFTNWLKFLEQKYFTGR